MGLLQGFSEKRHVKFFIWCLTPDRRSMNLKKLFREKKLYFVNKFPTCFKI